MKSISLGQQTVCGINRYQVKKVYGKWLHILYPLVESREYADLSNIVDPSFYKDNENTDPENKHTYQR